MFSFTFHFEKQLVANKTSDNSAYITSYIIWFGWVTIIATVAFCFLCLGLWKLQMIVTEMNKMHNGKKVRLDHLQTLIHLACLIVYLVASLFNWITEWSIQTSSNPNTGCTLSRCQIIICIF